MTTYAVTGATGQLGRLTIAKLKEKVPAQDIIALVRDVNKAADLGVTARQADYTDQDSLDKALQGVDKLYLISGSEVGQRASQHKNIIAAAVKNGVKHIVYTSLLRADSSPLSVAKEHPITEQDLKDSGLTYTILRNGWYHENYTGSIGAALALGAFYGSAKDGKIASASRLDYAEAGVAVLTGAGHENKTYELAGDSAYTLAELAQEISKQTGKDIPYVDITPEEYAKALTDAGVDAGFAELIAGWDKDAAQGALYSDDKTLSQLIARPTTPIAQAVADALV